MVIQGTWDDVFGKSPPKVAALASALAALLRALNPACVEVARPGDKAVSFGWGAAKMSQAYAYLMPQKDRVNLGFYQGANLPDPAGLLEGTGKSMRHVKVHDEALAQSAPLRALVLAAMEKSRANGGLE